MPLQTATEQTRYSDVLATLLAEQAKSSSSEKIGRIVEVVRCTDPLEYVEKLTKEQINAKSLQIWWHQYVVASRGSNENSMKEETVGEHRAETIEKLTKEQIPRDLQAFETALVDKPIEKLTKEQIPRDLQAFETAPVDKQVALQTATKQAAGSSSGRFGRIEIEVEDCAEATSAVPQTQTTTGSKAEFFIDLTSAGSASGACAQPLLIEPDSDYDFYGRPVEYKKPKPSNPEYWADSNLTVLVGASNSSWVIATRLPVTNRDGSMPSASRSRSPVVYRSVRGKATWAMWGPYKP